MLATSLTVSDSGLNMESKADIEDTAPVEGKETERPREVENECWIVDKQESTNGSVHTEEQAIIACF